MPGQSQRRWSPLHNLQGNLTFHGGLEGLPTRGAFGVIAAWLASYLFDFFFFFFFFIFLASWLLDFKLSPIEVEEEGEEIREEGEGSALESS